MTKSKPLYIDADKIEWDDTYLNLSKLPKGPLKSKILRKDDETGEIDMLIQFPPNYFEPKHIHTSSHSVVVLKGTIGTPEGTLGVGSMVFGPPNVPHGPFQWDPEGTIVFAHFKGDPTHKY